MPINEMLETIDSPLISEYMAYDRIACIGNEKIEFMIAQLSSLIANVHGNKTKIADFLPKQDAPKVSVADKIKAIFKCQKI